MTQCLWKPSVPASKHLFFGARFTEQPLGINGLPVFLEEVCFLLLSPEAAATKGMFRIPGDVCAIQTLRAWVENGLSLESCTTSLSDEDQVHVLGGVLKKYLNELPEPLIPTGIYQYLVDLWNEHNGISKVTILQAIRGHYDLHRGEDVDDVQWKGLLFLFEFLHRFSKYSDITKMDAKNLSIVFGPNIFRAPSEISPMVEAQQMHTANKIVEILIAECDRSGCTRAPYDFHFDTLKTIDFDDEILL